MVTYEYELLSNEGKTYHALRVFKNGSIWATASCPATGDDAADLLCLKQQALEGIEDLDEAELTTLLG